MAVLAIEAPIGMGIQDRAEIGSILHGESIEERRTPESRILRQVVRHLNQYFIARKRTQEGHYDLVPIVEESLIKEIPQLPSVQQVRARALMQAIDYFFVDPYEPLKALKKLKANPKVISGLEQEALLWDAAHITASNAFRTAKYQMLPVFHQSYRADSMLEVIGVSLVRFHQDEFDTDNKAGTEAFLTAIAAELGSDSYRHFDTFKNGEQVIAEFIRQQPLQQKPAVPLAA